MGAAEHLFQHYGYAKTTVADIAKQAGVGVGTVYLEFRSKHEIANELSSRYQDEILAAMSNAFAERDASYSQRFIQAMEAR